MLTTRSPPTDPPPDLGEPSTAISEHHNCRVGTVPARPQRPPHLGGCCRPRAFEHVYTKRGPKVSTTTPHCNVPTPVMKRRTQVTQPACGRAGATCVDGAVSNPDNKELIIKQCRIRRINGRLLEIKRPL